MTEDERWDMMETYVTSDGWHMLVLPYNMVLEEDKQDDAQQWVKEHAVGEWYNQGIIYVFKEISDATLFKMVWK